MTKQEHIDYWLKSAAEDQATVQALFNEQRYVHALFFAHLYLEKISKALWVKHNTDNHPPRIHNIEKILRQTTVELAEEDWLFAVNINRFNLEGRYPDYQNLIHKESTPAFTKEILERTETLKTCLLKLLQ